jgi:selenocysteine lyase/cysteine desulfurase
MAPLGNHDTTGIEGIVAASAAVADRSAEDVAADETYWREIEQGFATDRTLINLNNGHHCPSPRVVQEALKRYLDYENQDPVYYGGLINRNLETVRRRLAAEFGCDAEELAITRNASESLQIVQDGLDLKPGDEVITTDQDYPRMLTTWDQRQRRDRIKVTRIQFPVPTTQQDLYERFERAITPQTRVLHFCHITNLTGQLFPVQQLCRLARQRGVISIVDAAHSVAHFPFKMHDLECDYSGTSLHKWLCAPIGNGFLYVRKENIAKMWPLQAAAAARSSDIRKFEEVGTMPAAPHAAIAALSDAALGERAEIESARQNPLEPREGPDLGHGNGRDRRRRHASALAVHVGQVPHHRERGCRREAAGAGLRLPGAARHAERLHDARRDRHVRCGDGGCRQERCEASRMSRRMSSNRTSAIARSYGHQWISRFSSAGTSRRNRIRKKPARTFLAPIE